MAYRKPMVTIDGKQQVVARVVIARHLARELHSDELVHHVNGDPFDNAIENLQLVSRAEHKRIHDEIGRATRLQKQWHLDEDEIIRRFETESATVIARSIGCSSKTGARRRGRPAFV
jgi:hypothetical protein